MHDAAGINAQPTVTARPLRRARWASAVALWVAIVGAPAQMRAADPQPYTLSIAPTDDTSLDQALDAASTLGTLRESGPVGPFALIVRARGDVERLMTVLNSYGFYDAKVSVSIDGRGLDDPGLVGALEAAPAAPPAEVKIAIATGPLFHIGKVSIDSTVPKRATEQLRLDPGAPAKAADVLDAGARMLAALQAQGFAFAKVPPPVATLEPAQHVLDIAFTVTTGPRVDVGPVDIAGLKSVNESYVRRRLLLRPGELYTPRAIEKARADLAALDVFSSVRVRAAERLEAQSQLPVTFEVQERPKHVVNLSAGWSTDQGATAGVSWTNRNLFGNAERLTLSANVSNLGGTAAVQPGYNVGAELALPDLGSRGQTLRTSVVALRQFLEAYDQTAFTAGTTLERPLFDGWIGSLGLSYEREEVTQEYVTREYTVFGLPVAMKRDASNNLLDPTQGWRVAASITPTLPIGAGSSTFLIAQVAGSTYLDLADFNLTAPGRSVLAVRGLAGGISGVGVFGVPPDQRFYAGGSNTVRGFRYQSIGPQFADGKPTGGTSVSAGSVEFRQRFGDNLGAVAFVDAGQIGTNSNPFGGQVRVGVGAGARYYTIIGPVRLDVAVPINREPGGDSFEIYLGLGQAF